MCLIFVLRSRMAGKPYDAFLCPAATTLVGCHPNRFAVGTMASDGVVVRYCGTVDGKTIVCGTPNRHWRGIQREAPSVSFRPPHPVSTLTSRTSQRCSRVELMLGVSWVYWHFAASSTARSQFVAVVFDLSLLSLHFHRASVCFINFEISN